MIELINVNKTFYQDKTSFDALIDINLRIETGDIIGIIGHSGAGKSTLIRLINYLEKPTSGEVIIDGDNLTTFSKEQIRQTKKHIGMIFQQFNLLESKTVSENVGLPLLLDGISKKERQRKVDELLDFVELSDKKNSYPSELSGGQKQRVGIARALANNPTILLCDEATSALDPNTTRSILDLLKRINQEYNVTIAIVTHEMSVVKYICNKVIVMDKGRIIEHNTTKNIFKKPYHQMTRDFINSVINSKLPQSVALDLAKRGITDIYRLEFIGSTAQQPIISDIILKANGAIKINILFSSMADIKGEVIGYMFVNFIGEPLAITQCIESFKQHGVNVASLNSEGKYV